MNKICGSLEPCFEPSVLSVECKHFIREPNSADFFCKKTGKQVKYKDILFRPRCLLSDALAVLIRGQEHCTLACELNNG